MIKKIINRELSWLSFNERVLQEAEDLNVPLLDRLKFLGIFSNNQDEFFKVRVATIRRMAFLEKEAKAVLGVSPSQLLEKIQQKVLDLQKRFDACYFDLLKQLKKNNIHIINEHELTPEQGQFVKDYFHNKVRLHIFPIMVNDLKKFPVLHDTSIYLAVRFFKSESEKKDYVYSLLEVPVGEVPRFIVLPKTDENNYIIFLDDVIRYNLDVIYQIYDFDFIEAYTIKFTRDAELEIDNDVSQSFLVAVQKSLKRRKKAEPLRFIYDEEMPDRFLKFWIKKMNLKEKDSVIPGARYHNFKDFISFPKVGSSDFWYKKIPPIPHPDFHNVKSILDTMDEKDVLLYYPYHSFDYFLDLLREAAIDPAVNHIRLNIYRVADDSNVMKSLITAIRNGKKVTVLVELRARFDEAANIYWVNVLREEGVRVITGVNGLKVHSKLCLITRREGADRKYYGTIGTGNFHEKTATLYTDHKLFTSNQVIAKEVRQIFRFYEQNYILPQSTRLLTAPFDLRKKINALINKEIRNAKAGKPAEIFMKMNSLVDEDIIEKLYRASKAGVKIRLIVRGICSIIPGLKNWSENIEAISIVDRFLEHSRVFIFHNNGNQNVFIGSADMMTRNLDYRVEVICPILDKQNKQQLIDIMELQWSDNVKARVFTKGQDNNYKKVKAKSQTIRSQYAIRSYYTKFFKENYKKEIL